MIYFDNAATTGHKPKEVVAATLLALKKYSVNPGRGGYKQSLECSQMIYDCRKELALFFGADSPDRVIFTSNCTAALNFVIKGVLKAGDHCIASCFEHNAVARPLYKMSTKGVLVDFADVKENDDDTVEAFRRLIRPNTKLIICTHASNVNGKVLPIEKIGKLCKEKNILFAVDAAQTAGILPINMKEMGIDFLCIASHKGLYSPMGLGVLIANKELENTLIEGGTGTNSLRFEQPKELPERFESGTVNVPAIAGLLAGLKFVKDKKLENIYSHEMTLLKAFYEQLSEIDGVVLYSDYPQNYKTVPTVSFNVKALTSEELADILSEKGIAVRAGIHCAPLAHKKLGTSNGGTVRVCFSVFNNLNQVSFVTDVIKKVVKKL